MLLLVVLPIVVSSTLAFYLYRYQEVLQNLGLLETLLYFIIVAITMTFALTPTTFVALVTGFYFGWPGFLGVVLSYGLAALLGYGLAQLIDHGKMLAFLQKFKKVGAVMEE